MYKSFTYLFQEPSYAIIQRNNYRKIPIQSYNYDIVPMRLQTLSNKDVTMRMQYLGYPLKIKKSIIHPPVTSVSVVNVGEEDNTEISSVSMIQDHPDIDIDIDIADNQTDNIVTNNSVDIPTDIIVELSAPPPSPTYMVEEEIDPVVPTAAITIQKNVSTKLPDSDDVLIPTNICKSDKYMYGTISKHGILINGENNIWEYCFKLPIYWGSIACNKSGTDIVAAVVNINQSQNKQLYVSNNCGMLWYKSLSLGRAHGLFTSI